jgi:UDP-N-acetylglucosamine acyltransferase
MPEIHHTAVLEGEIELADEVRIGPYCVINGPVSIGKGTRLLGQVWLQGPLSLGEHNTVYPNVCLGFAPQSLGYDADLAGPGVKIGDYNVFREGVTAHRATDADAPTAIGDHNYFMANAHAGHDARIDDRCVFANGALVGGHAHVEDGVFVGGNAAIHQFCRIGRGAMLSGEVGTSRDLPPFFTLTGINVAGSINLVGLRRSGMPRDQIDDVRWVYRMLYRRGLSLAGARRALEERAERPLVAEYIRFIDSSKRGICRARPDPRRSQG